MKARGGAGPGRGGPRAGRGPAVAPHGPPPREGAVRLADLSPGCRGRIVSLSCRGKLRRRLMDMGVVAGTPFEVERVAPLGDPVELKLKDFHLSLRREEAGDIWVEIDGGE